MDRDAKIVIAGEGGQGVQTIAMILSEAAYEEGYDALYIPNFGVEQRGGVSVAYIQISNEPIGSPKFKDADVAVALSKRSIWRISKYCCKETVFLYEGEITGVDGQFPKDCKEIIKVPAIKIAKDEFHPKVFNVIILGVIIGITNVVSIDTVKGIIEAQLGYKFEKNPELRDMNYKALKKGVELALNR
ncbi:MAG: ketoisovalerate oxidoreductase [Clostridia bacterium]|nr:ketoisovalerate oxidoreductase [Clostridia bacterium]